MEDGGRFPDGKPVQVLTVDAEHEVNFKFAAGSDSGIYRVSLHRGSDWKTFQLWAESTPATAANP